MVEGVTLVRTMRFVSTRDAAARPHSFEECLFRGFADDGGMFLPASVPSLSPDTLRSWVGLSYGDLATRILALFIDEDEIPAADLRRIVDKAFT
jgi:threonine synthase